jgi:arylsulfatase A
MPRAIRLLALPLVLTALPLVAAESAKRSTPNIVFILADDTLVIFTSDNGPEGNGDKGRTRGSTGGLRGRKRAMYEGGIRVPGIVRWPGKIAANRTSDVPVIGSDWFATVLAATGVAPPKDRVLDGANALPVLKGEATSVTRSVPLYWRLRMAPGKIQVALRQDDWKILASDELDGFELYNLKDDPREEHNLRDSEPERFAALQKELTALHAQIEAEGPDWWRRLSPSGGGPPQQKKP